MHFQGRCRMHEVGRKKTHKIPIAAASSADENRPISIKVQKERDQICVFCKAFSSSQVEELS